MKAYAHEEKKKSLKYGFVTMGDSHTQSTNLRRATLQLVNDSFKIAWSANGPVSAFRVSYLVEKRIAKQSKKKKKSFHLGQKRLLF